MAFLFSETSSDEIRESGVSQRKIKEGGSEQVSNDKTSLRLQSSHAKAPGITVISCI